jgi:hypothetical protein
MKLLHGMRYHVGMEFYMSRETHTKQSVVNPADQQPVFLVGSERSGTTLLRLMLDCHPRIAFHAEFEFSVDMVGDHGERPDLQTYYDYLQCDRVFKHFGFRIDPELDYDRLVASFLEQKRKQSGCKPKVGATVHRAFDRLPFIWPNAKYVHMLRDPRPVADSIIRMGWAGTHWHAAGKWKEAEQTWDALVATVNEQQWLQVRYETLLADTDATLEKICAFIGESYCEQMLEYHRVSTYPKVDPSNSDKWRSRMTRRQMQLVEARLGSIMMDRCYTAECAPISVSRFRRGILGVVNKTSRMCFSMRLFGVRLYLEDWIARRLTCRNWQARTRRKMHAITERNLR